MSTKITRRFTRFTRALLIYSSGYSFYSYVTHLLVELLILLITLLIYSLIRSDWSVAWPVWRHQRLVLHHVNVYKYPDIRNIFL